MIIVLLNIAFNVSSLELKTWDTMQGTRVMYYHAPEIPMADIRIIFSAGSVRDGTKFGLSRMANKLLLEGTEELDAEQFKGKLSETGARLYVGSLREMAFINLRTLTESKYYNVAVDLLIDACISPIYNKTEVDRAIADLLLDLSLKNESPSQIAQEAIWKQIYKGHPYSNYPGGTESTLPSITSSELREFHSSYYTANNATIAIVGSISEAKAKELADRISSSLPVGAKPNKVPEFVNFRPTNTYIESNSKQTHMRIGSLGISRDDEDYFPMILGNHILGGSSLVSKLFTEIRTKRGLSYSVYSYFIPTEIKGPFILGLQTSGGKQDIALRESKRVLKNFIENGPSPESFELAKENLINGFINQIDSNRKMVNYISMIGFYGLPYDYLSTFTEKVKLVTIEDVKEAFRRRFNDNFSIVLVGSRKSDFGKE